MAVETEADLNRLAELMSRGFRPEFDEIVALLFLAREGLASQDDFASVAQKGFEWMARAEAAEAQLVASRGVVEAAGDIDIGAVQSLVNGMSLPMEMQPARERWLRQIAKLRAALTAYRKAVQGG